jgi:hypothetical protein
MKSYNALRYNIFQACSLIDTPLHMWNTIIFKTDTQKCIYYTTQSLNLLFDWVHVHA